MGKKDLWQSDYFDDDVRFADLYNGALFEGRTIIKPEELESCDSVMVHHFENRSSKKIICDKIRKWKGKYLTIFPLETQSYVDYRMVLRTMLEDVLSYEKQRKHDFKDALRKGYKFDGNELLSGMRKDLKLTPVIPLILYLGTESEWSGAKTLHELLEIDEELKPFVNNYKLNFYDFHGKTDFSYFKTENKLLFEVLSNLNNKEKIEQLFREESEKYALDKDSATALLGITGIKIDLDKLKIEKDGKVEYKMYKMCKAFEEITKEARDEGYESGINEGYKSGVNEGYKSGVNEGYKSSIKALMDTMNLTLEQALDALKITGTDRTKFYS